MSFLLTLTDEHSRQLFLNTHEIQTTKKDVTNTFAILDIFVLITKFTGGIMFFLKRNG